MRTMRDLPAPLTLDNPKPLPGRCVIHAERVDEEGIRHEN
jgi:hypothetical protein